MLFHFVLDVFGFVSFSSTYTEYITEFSRGSIKTPYSEYLKRRTLVIQDLGFSHSHALAQEGLAATRQGIAKFLQRVEKTGNLHRWLGSGRPSIMTPQVINVYR